MNNNQIIKYFINIFKIFKRIFSYKKSNNRNIFIIGTPSHGNGGDIAITLAQLEILKKFFPNDNIYDVSGTEYYLHYYPIKHICKKKDIFTFIGGGNFGNQYMLEEGIRRHLVKHFPNNKIIMFPQSVYYTKNDTGEKEKQITHEILKKHKKVILSARDKYSYSMMKEYFPEHKTLLIPDIVFYLEPKIQAKRKGASICLRKDLEGLLSDNQKKMIETKLNTVFSKVTYTDTWVDYNGEKQQRKILLNNKLKEFASSELVVTDRIHGMIFATITGTPCIVLPNYNHKVKGAYDWINDFGYIKYANDVDEVLKYIDELKKTWITTSKAHNDNCKNMFNSYYDELMEECRE